MCLFGCWGHAGKMFIHFLCSGETQNLELTSSLSTSDYDKDNALVPIVQCCILGVVVIFAVLARIADAKTALVVDRLAHRRCVH